MANSQDSAHSPDLDLLAAVVLHTLVTEGREGITPTRVALACERDPKIDADMAEIEAALKLLLDDGLAEGESEGDGDGDGESEGKGKGKGDSEGQRRSGRESNLFRPTRAAIRATELSF